MRKLHKWRKWRKLRNPRPASGASLRVDKHAHLRAAHDHNSRARAQDQVGRAAGAADRAPPIIFRPPPPADSLGLEIEFPVPVSSLELALELGGQLGGFKGGNWTPMATRQWPPSGTKSRARAPQHRRRSSWNSVAIIKPSTSTPSAPTRPPSAALPSLSADHTSRKPASCARPIDSISSATHNSRPPKRQPKRPTIDHSGRSARSQQVTRIRGAFFARPLVRAKMAGAQCVWPA